MARFRLEIEYDGAPFMGWQRQPHGPTIQQALEEAVQAFSGEIVIVEGAGRTDTGVHAVGQVGHIDLEKDFAPNTIRDAINFHLHDLPIIVHRVASVAPSFHARFSANMRHYRYHILNRPTASALKAGRVWHIRKKLNLIAMRKAGKLLEGKHDFSSFRGKYCQATTPLKTMSHITITKADEENIYIDVSAPSFLHHQVRNIVGTLRPVGEEKMPPEQMAVILKACDRRAAGVTAPAAGLFLMKVDYETDEAEPSDKASASDKSSHSSRTQALFSVS